MSSVEYGCCLYLNHHVRFEEIGDTDQGRRRPRQRRADPDYTLILKGAPGVHDSTPTLTNPRGFCPLRDLSARPGAMVPAGLVMT